MRWLKGSRGKPGSQGWRSAAALTHLTCLLPLPSLHRPGSRVRDVMASLAAALPAGSYSRLQRLLMAKGLLRDVDVPVDFV